MAETYYSWTTFVVPNQHPSEWIKPGDEVTQEDLSTEDYEMPDDEFEALISDGAIRQAPYPIPRDENTGQLVFQGSPREYALAQIAKLTDDQMLESVASTFVVPQLQAKAQQALADAEFDPGPMPDEEAVAEATATEEGRLERNVMPPGGKKVTGAAADRAKTGAAKEPDTAPTKEK